MCVPDVTRYHLHIHPCSTGCTTNQVPLLMNLTYLLQKLYELKCEYEHPWRMSIELTYQDFICVVLNCEPKCESKTVKMKLRGSYNTAYETFYNRVIREFHEFESNMKPTKTVTTYDIKGQLLLDL